MPTDRVQPVRETPARSDGVGHESAESGSGNTEEAAGAAASLFANQEQTDPVRKKVVERLGGDVYERIDFIVAILDQNNPEYDQIVTLCLVQLVRYFPQIKRAVWDARNATIDELMKEIQPRVTLASKIEHQLIDYDDDQSERMEALYNNGTPEQKKLLDDFCTCMCGHTIERLMMQTALGAAQD